MAREQRRLAAIVCADVVGFSRLVGMDEADTLARLKAIRRELIDPKISENGGRLVKTTGDGLLVEFSSVVDAVRCVMAVQEEMAQRDAGLPSDRRIELRIGVHVGDIVIDGADILGDGINVAARLEALAEPGGVCVSGRVQEDLAGKVELDLRDGGNQTLKNIARPVRVWRWAPGVTVAAPAPVRPTNEPLAPPDKPSIAVLPFQNMSGDPEQEYFTDGISEDIITDLTRFRSLFVVARNSSFTYKEKAVDVRTIARELGVRYVLEGSCRKASTRVRVTAQLIDATSGNHIWAERYDRVLEDIFAVQEEVTRSIIAAIAPEIEASEVAKARRPIHLGAYEIAVRANAKAIDGVFRFDSAMIDEAIQDARAALAIDDRNLIALRVLAYCQWSHVQYGTAQDRDAAWQEGMAAANKAIEADRSDCDGYANKALLLLQASDQDRIKEALTSARYAHELNPNSMNSLTSLAVVETMAGDPEAAKGYLIQAMRISPRDPFKHFLHLLLAQVCLLTGQYAQGVDHSILGLGDRPQNAILHAQLAMNQIGAGDVTAARAAVAEARRLGPGYVERLLTGRSLLRNPAHLRRQVTFLRIAAGLEDPSAAEALR